MKHFFMIVNLDKEAAEETAGKVKDYLEAAGCTCVISGTNGKRYDSNGKARRFTSARTVPKKTECVITIGGDGTVIRAARDLAGKELPLFGINRGHLGFLTHLSREDEMEPALNALIEDRFRIERRMMLHGTIYRNGEKIEENIALNDIVLNHANGEELRFNVRLNGMPLNEYAADGMIVCTATGSTAYNLSAGGPIAAPDSSVIILTPICPHTLNTRSLILPKASRIELEMSPERSSRQILFFDGDRAGSFTAGDVAVIERSEMTTPIIQLKEEPFLEKIRRTLKQI